MAAAAAALCVLAAGCGTVKFQAHARAGLTTTAAGNHAAARAEAARLLTLVKVPSGAVRLARTPRAPSGPERGSPGVSTLVERVVSWRLGMPITAVQAWLSAHHPHLPTNGSFTYTSGGQVTSGGTGYRGAANPAWQSADLEIGAAPAGPHASVIRADAVVIWLDPRPVPSRPGNHPLRVNVTGTCPTNDKNVTGVTNPGAKLTERLLPPGQPTAGLRCRYDGLNGHPWHLVAATRLTARAARQAAKSMNAIPLSHTDGGMVNCPMDDGSAELLALSYPGRPDVDLWVHLNGCGGVSNGYISAGQF
jgi:hypothetical protein